MRVLEIGGQPAPKAHLYFREADEILHLDAHLLHEPDFLCDAELVTLADVGGEPYDAVFASHVLEHFHWVRVEQVFERWLGLLKPGGEIYIIVPDLGWVCENLHKHPWHVQPHLMGGMMNEWDYHKVMFTQPMLRDLFERKGLVITSSHLRQYVHKAGDREMTANEIHCRGIIPLEVPNES